MTDKGKSPPIQPSLVGEKVYLRPTTADDIVNTYHWYLMSNPQAYSPYAVKFSTAAEAAEEFRKQAGSTGFQRFMVIRRKDRMPVGWIRYFHFNGHNRSAALDLIIDPDERRKGHALEATRLLCRYLFESRGLNKVYANVAEYAGEMIGLLEKLGFQRDGILRRHYFRQGEYHDGYLYSLLSFEAKR